MSQAHYDLYASEARILSFSAMMLGQVEADHWRHLSRSAMRSGRQRALLSWSGTMFEYLMPDLFLPVFPGTLLHQTQQAVLERQMAAEVDVKGGRLWGISESGYYAFDAAMNYQYVGYAIPNLAAIELMGAEEYNASPVNNPPQEALDMMAREQGYIILDVRTQ